MANTFAQHLLALTGDHTPTAQPVKAAKPFSRTTYAGVVLTMALGSASVAAATDGQLANKGAASSGSLNLSLVIPERLDVSGINNVSLKADANGGLSGQTSACISGHGSDQYHLSAIGSGIDGRFEAMSGSKAVSFDVAYSTAADEQQVLTMGQALERLAGAGAKGCSDNANNAKLSLRMNQTANNPAGSQLPFRGALTLVLSPE